MSKMHPPGCLELKTHTVIITTSFRTQSLPPEVNDVSYPHPSDHPIEAALWNTEIPEGLTPRRDCGRCAETGWNVSTAQFRKESSSTTAPDNLAFPAYPGTALHCSSFICQASKVLRSASLSQPWLSKKRVHVDRHSSAPLRRQASSPISRPPFVVRYGDHFNAALDLSIDDVVGKLAKDVPPRTRLEGGPNGGSARDQRDRVRRFVNKRLCGLDAPFKIPLKRVIDLPTGFRDKLNPGGAHSASPRSRSGSLPKESSPRPRLPLREPPLPGAKPIRHRHPAQAPGSPRER